MSVLFVIWDIVGFVVKDEIVDLSSWDVLFGSKKIFRYREKIICWWED